MVAEANGLEGDQDLRVGQMLELPARLGGTYNNAGTYAPYDPSAIAGDTSPYLTTPAARITDDGCGMLGVLLMVVVTVAVTVATQGAAGPQMTAWLGSGTAAAVATGAVAGAAGAIAGGASAGVSGVQVGDRMIGGIEALKGAKTAAVVARSMVANALTQRVSVVLGLQDDFDWKRVAAAGAGAWAGNKVGERLRQPVLTGSVSAAERATASSMTASFVTAVAQGGRLDAIQVAVDIFGNQIGQSLADAMVPRSTVVPAVRSGGSLPFPDGQTLVLRDGGPAPDPEATRSFVDTLGDMMVRQSLEAVSLAGTTQYADAARFGRGAHTEFQLGRKQYLFQSTEEALAFAQAQVRALAAGRSSPDVGLQLSPQAAAAQQEFRQSEIRQMNEVAGQESWLTIESAALASTAAQPLSPAMQHVQVAADAAVTMVTELPATVVDLGQAAIGASYTFATGDTLDLTMYSGAGQSAQAGASTGEMLQNLNPVYGALIGHYEVRQALRRGDTRPLAAMGGALLGGAAIGRVLPSVPGYRTGTFSPSTMQAARFVDEIFPGLSNSGGSGRYGQFGAVGDLPVRPTSGTSNEPLKLSTQAKKLFDQHKYSEALDVHYEDLVRLHTKGTSQIINGREYDSVTADAIIQAKRTHSSIDKPKNFLSKSTRSQIKETINLATEQGKRAEFWFKCGIHPEVLLYIEQKGGVVVTGLGD